ncbi:Nuclear pore complex protein NUP107 [Striga hermonthica]|uniref:Nuclear pore complex protein NUP107 n=1 Tax=Striga hermonthica TaxID=68872 RepID=A0A9N7MVV3_STRHE|nr:Nuclear pore complex protein NUP107 [Striga hermonthica]
MSSFRRFSDGRRRGGALQKPEQNEKPNFVRTCNLLSKYIKKKRSLRDFHIEIGDKIESLQDIIMKPGSNQAESASTTMKTVRNNGKTAEPLKEQQPRRAHQDLSINTVLDPSSYEPKSKEAGISTPKTAELTIFYSGRVLVFEDYPAEKAQELVAFAKKQSSQVSNGILSDTVQENAGPSGSQWALNSSPREGLPPRPPPTGSHKAVGIALNTCEVQTNDAVRVEQQQATANGSVMEVEMETSPSYFDPEDLSDRERFRRYGKRHPSSSLSPHYDNSASRFSNAALFLENIKHEVENFDADIGGTSYESGSKRRASIYSDAETIRRRGSESLKVCKQEEHEQSESVDTTFSLFASLLDSCLQGLMPIPDLILHFENSCRNVSESIRFGANERYRIVEDKLMRQRARFLLDEAASWSLLWYLYGKGDLHFPTTSHLEACQFVTKDHNAQLCLRIVQWLEGLASKALDLDNKVRGSHVGTYLPSSGVWHHTQRHLKRGASNTKTIKHLDFDAPTREHSHQLPDDKKQDESLLEDIWTLLRAGRLEEACSLCRSAGQPWRASSLCPFGGLNLFPSIEAVEKNGKNRMLQAIELESGIGHQWRLWRWASYCASEKIAEEDGGKYERAVYAAQSSNLKRLLPVCSDWESACWALAKSWLDVQVDIEIARMRSDRTDLFKNLEEAMERSPGQKDLVSQQSSGPDTWPLKVLSQQPRDLTSLLQKLHSSDAVNEAVTRACKEQHRQIEMNLMLGNIPHLLDLIFSWISPSEDDGDIFRPHGDPQMMRFGAHLVLVLRYLLADQMQDTFREKIMTIGDFIIHMYAMFLFTKQHEELVGVYASQLARHRCVDLFVHMMELRLNSSAHVRYKIFVSAIEYLPFSSEDDSKGSFEEIIERILSRSREVSFGKHEKSSDVAEQHRLQSLQKAMVIQWLCFTPPSTINDARAVTRKLVLRALMHSNLLFREFALISMWRVPAVPVGAHTVLSLLAEPLKHLTEVLISSEDHEVSENLREFQDWSEYYSCDAKYRNWLKVELANAEVSPGKLSEEERQRKFTAARETLESSLLLLQRKENSWLVPTQDHVHESEEPVYLEVHATAVLSLPSGELPRFKAGVTMEISRLDAWYSSSDGSLEGSATYIVCGLCRKCCIPEIFLRCMQVSVSLMESGYRPERHHELIELVNSPETDFLSLFSQNQLQEFLLFERDYTLYETNLEEGPNS